MENCCLCLESLDTKPPLQTLTCGHTIHYRCYCRLCYHKATFYIECPLCRSKNYKFDRPYNNPKFNLLALCSPGVGIHRCYGPSCQNPSHMFNYGYCHQCRGPVLNRKHRSIFLVYFEYLFTSVRKRFKTKVFMLDMAKQLIIQNDYTRLEQILLAFTNYFQRIEYQKTESPEMFYKDHNLQMPPQSWVDFCVERKLLF